MKKLISDTFINNFSRACRQQLNKLPANLRPALNCSSLDGQSSIIRILTVNRKLNWSAVEHNWLGNWAWSSTICLADRSYKNQAFQTIFTLVEICIQKGDSRSLSVFYYFCDFFNFMIFCFFSIHKTICWQCSALFVAIFGGWWL